MNRPDTCDGASPASPIAASGLPAHSDPRTKVSGTPIQACFSGRKLLPQIGNEFDDLHVVKTVLEGGM